MDPFFYLWTYKRKLHFKMCCIRSSSEQKEKEIKGEKVGLLHLTVCARVYLMLTERLQCVSDQSTRTARAERRKRFLWSSGYPRNGWRKGNNGCMFISSLINILSLHLRFSSTECCHLFWLMQWMICFADTNTPDISTVQFFVFFYYKRVYNMKIKKFALEQPQVVSKVILKNVCMLLY